jgi:predicted nucleotidyltransferase
MADSSRVALSAEQLATLQSLLAEHDVRLAVLFGSATRPESDQNDIDLAVEFDDWRPDDEGYATAYLGLSTALEEELDVAVDLVDVHSADDRFAAVILEDGVLIRGSQERKAHLADQVRDAYPSIEDARERVAAAVTRLEENAR